MIAYFDTAVFDSLYSKAGHTSADIANLRKAIYGRELSIRLSIHSLEEILIARKAPPQALAAQLKLTLSLANSRTMIKPCDQLLRDDIRAYAASGAADRPFLRGDLQNACAEGIAAVVESDGEEFEEEFAEVLEQTRRGKERVREVLAQTAARAGARVQTQRPSFDQYWDAYASRAAEVLAETIEPSCAIGPDRIDGLLRVKSVRMAAGIALSSAYEAAFDPDYDPGSSARFHHAISAAAAAEAFVAGDARMGSIVARVPVDGFAVLDLPAFLKTIA
ncbi:MAG TPA: hypothetical protein VJ718_00025 [Candidatus Binataceae bacterium]|nr:hypothetical protein [Candidatus Binataceae bacterium]